MTTHLPNGEVNVLDGDSEGDFFVLEPGVGGDERGERGPFEWPAKDGQLAACSHNGFRRPMDAIDDVRSLNGLRESCDAPWEVWR